MRYLPMVLGTLVMTAACQSGNESGLQHIFGKTTRPAQAGMAPCIESQDPALISARNYVAGIARYIMARNPQTFTGDYAPEKFCFGVTDSTEVNASAFARSRAVIVDAGMLEAVGNDGNVAAVMAHELSHITMQHGDEENETITNDPRWKASGEALSAHLKDVETKRFAVKDESQKMLAEMQALEESLNAAETAGTKAMRLQVEATYETLADSLDEALGQGENYTAILGLSIMLKPALPRFAGESQAEIEPSQDPNYAALKSKVDQYLANRTAWLAAEQQALPDMWQKLNAAAARSKVIDEQYNDLYADRDATMLKLKELRKAILGERGETWREDEADEVGLELYLRAGLSPLNYYGFFDLLNEQDKDGAASCAAQVEASSVSHGDGTHANTCWRYYNAKVLEMNEHAKDYEPFVPTAVKTEIFPGQLAAVKKVIASLRDQ